jgi:hypothetical protein
MVCPAWKTNKLKTHMDIAEPVSAGAKKLCVQVWIYKEITADASGVYHTLPPPVYDITYSYYASPSPIGYVGMHTDMHTE